MRILWSRQKTEMPHVSAVIDGGLNKLANYEEYMSAVPAYTLATSMFSYILVQLGLFYFSSKPNHEATMVRKKHAISHCPC